MTTATMTRREELEALVVTMETFADEIDAKPDGATAEDHAKLVKMGKDVQALVKQIKDEAATTGTLDEAKGFLAQLAGRTPDDDRRDEDQRRFSATGIVNPNGMTLAQAFTASPAFEDFVKQFKGPDGAISNMRGIRSASFDVGSFAPFDGVGRGPQAALVTGTSDTSGGAFVQPFRYAPVTDLIGERELTVRDLCTNVPITSDTFEFVRVTGKTNAAAGVPEATTAADPAAPAPAGAEIAAGGYKPESALTLAVVSTPVETIAHLMPITRRAAADAPQVRALVDQFLLYGLREEEEDQILNGNGTSPNLRGILQDAAISTVGSAGTDLDAIVDAIRTIRADRRRPTGMVIHPNDWYSTGFMLAKDSTGRYLIGDPNASIEAQQALWGLRVVVTEAMTENTALVGDFRMAVVADRQQAAIYVTDSHKDWFGRNLLAVLAEERLALGVLDPDAFCTVTAI